MRMTAFTFWKIAISVLLLAASTAAATAQPCVVRGLGVDYATVDGNDGRVRYRLEIAHRQWELDSFGWHAQTMLGCSGCKPGGVQGGVMWMSAEADAVRLPTAAEDEAFVLLTGSAWFAAGGTRGIQFHDELKGEWSGLPMVARRFVGGEAGARNDHIALTAADGCLGIRFYLQSESAHRLPLADALGGLLGGVAIRREPAR